jgi:phospholipid/cholesterol/gamma-HCH transport system substrate-binding protein
MSDHTRSHRPHPLWWTAGLFAVIIAIAAVCSMIFAGTFRSYVPVTVTSDRAGLVMEPGAKVKLRGIVVGQVADVSGGREPAALRLEITPDEINHIPANVEAEIKSTTIFGAKYVDLIYPEHPSTQRLAAGAVLQSRNVTTEVNTVFENLVGVLQQVDVSKLNSVLTALADGVRGQGERMGQAITDSNQVLQAINPRMDTLAQDWRSLKGFSDTYGAAAKDILATLDAATTTSTTITNHATQLDALLLSSIGFSTSGTNLLGSTKDNLVNAIGGLAPTTQLLLKYNPSYTCLLQGAQTYLEKGGLAAYGANGKSVIVDGSLTWGSDAYTYPDNLPIVAAKGGPGGQPGCGSLPDVAKNFPVRYTVTNTGWGTGLDLRPNPGIGHPWYVDFFPVTRAVPQPPSYRGEGPPAIGPVPYPGAPPYGAPLYGPDGTPLYPGVPPAPPPAAAPAPDGADAPQPPPAP